MNVLHTYTRRCLKKNRVRTVMTIIGIAISVAMFTAVTEAAVSALNYMIEYTKGTEGSYHGLFNSMTEEEYEELASDPRIDTIGKLSNEGYAQVDEARTNMYIYLAGVDEDAVSLMPIQIEDGRMPENSAELLIPNHLRNKFPSKLSIGTELELEVGCRFLGENVLNQLDAYSKDETIRNAENKTFTVVGFYSRLPLDFESYDTPGYTALTVDEDGLSPYDDYLVMFSAKNPAETGEILEKYGEGKAYRTNGTLLALENSSLNSAVASAIYGLSAILILIIVFGSVALIYNSFSISLSERTRQFGILSSVGATRRQIRGSVIYEALVLCVFGIPLGLISGYAGIGITFALMGDKMANLFRAVLDGELLTMRIVFKPGALAVAALIGLVTTLISAMIPAVRASRLTPVDAIRQTEDINLKGRQVKSGLLAQKFLGFEGSIASKNFRRNKKRYRAVVVSLFSSIVLFISATAFSSYLRTATDGLSNTQDYDIIVTGEYFADGYDDIFKEMLAQPHIDDGMMYSNYTTFLYFDENLIDPAFSESNRIPAYLKFMDDESFVKLCHDYMLDGEALLNGSVPSAIVFDMDYKWVEDGTYEIGAIFDGSSPQSFELVKPRTIEGYTMISRSLGIGENGGEEDYFSVYAKTDELNYNGYRYVTPAETLTVFDGDVDSTVKVNIAAVVHESPDSISGLSAYLPNSAMEKLTGGYTTWTCMSFHAEDFKSAEQELYRTVADAHVGLNLFNAADTTKTQRSLVMVIDVMSYGFIILISLIALVNVFNTISTSIILRRRELAVLRSVGMTYGGFKRMMSYECLLYGIRSVAAGVPVSILLSWLMYRSLEMEDVTSYTVPWAALAIAVGSVFAVVFITMLYAMHRVKGDNTVETLRSEYV